MQIIKSFLVLVFAFNLLNACQAMDYRSTYAKSANIIGGEKVDNLKDYQFYAELHYAGRFACGGSVISENHVLTAKHCVIAAELISLEIVNSSKRYKVKGYWTAPDSDVAIIRTYDTMNVEPVRLSERIDYPYVGQQLEVAGKGRQDDWSLPDHLRRVEIPVIAHDVCSSMFGGYGIKDSEICAYEQGKGSCFGDSGGPLWDPEEKVQYGIVSWGGVDCRRPSVFANVAFNIKSIKNIAGIKDKPKPDPKPDPKPEPKPDDEDDCCCCCCCCHHKKESRKKKCNKNMKHDFLMWRD